MLWGGLTGGLAGEARHQLYGAWAVWCDLCLEVLFGIELGVQAAFAVDAHHPDDQPQR